MLSDTDICVWCSKTYAEHKDVIGESEVVPRVPCHMTKNGFAKTKGQSPTPTKKQDARMLSFGEAMELVKDGKRITKLEWNNIEEYGVLKDGWLMIVRSGKFYTWTISDGDLMGTDYIILPEGN